MTKLSAERLAAIRQVAVASLDYRALDLLDHIDALQAEHNESQVNMHKMLSAIEAERDALARVVSAAIKYANSDEGTTAHNDLLDVLADYAANNPGTNEP